MKTSTKKYKPFPQVAITDRTWPDKTITKAPRWCSVDLRDGNQALKVPMNLEQKLKMFKHLVDIGFKEIEIGFPSASQVEFDFARTLIEQKLIPEGVTIQVLTQAREELIKRTCESLRGAKRAVIHMYNSTSELQRRVVFRMNREEVKNLAVTGTQWVKKYSAQYLKGTDVQFEYSPESFTGTELDFAVDVCTAVMDAWKPKVGEKVIINLPNTVEQATPNIYADQIEWFCRNFPYRKQAIISLHCHNDRGTAVAATELALMAGADRVEGTLFGNGERTGNVDIVTLALNLYSQGILPELNFSDIDRSIEVYKECTDLPVHPRHPYAGELVFTAFSGSHQDAINKGFIAMKASKSHTWEIPYIPMDPKDVGRSYDGIVRINSQSGKGGVAYILEREFGYRLPKPMHPEFGKVIQRISDETGKEVLSKTIQDAFLSEYVKENGPIVLKRSSLQEEVDADGVARTTATRYRGRRDSTNSRGVRTGTSFRHRAGKCLTFPVTP
ncbi:MAG: 2-isopropylmalate synthase [Parcubacteria group bacterium GW2011_GWA2_49_9]|nr:MAG: 2-isopropylmalate synthase [Parcubacteria group bacterium GW2011_GWA2_49_9]